MNKIHKQVLEKARDICYGTESDWINCFDDIIFHTTQTQINATPDHIIKFVEDFYDKRKNSEIHTNAQTELLNYFISYDIKLIKDKKLRKKFQKFHEIWSIAFPTVMYLEPDEKKFTTKSKTISELQSELWVIYENSKEELLSQFQYDEYIMKNYPSKIRKIISVTGYVKKLTDDEDHLLNLQIINEIDMKIICTHPNKKLQKQWGITREIMHESWNSAIFIDDYLSEDRE